MRQESEVHVDEHTLSDRGRPPVSVSDGATDTETGRCIFQPADAGRHRQSCRKLDRVFKEEHLWEMLSRLIHYENKCLTLPGM